MLLKGLHTSTLKVSFSFMYLQLLLFQKTQIKCILTCIPLGTTDFLTLWNRWWGILGNRLHLNLDPLSMKDWNDEVDAIITDMKNLKTMYDSNDAAREILKTKRLKEQVAPLLASYHVSTLVSIILLLVYLINELL